jgi:hypothetical protein
MIMKNIMYVVFVMLMLGLTGCMDGQWNSYTNVKKAFPDNAIIEKIPYTDNRWFVKVGTNLYYVWAESTPLRPARQEHVRPMFNSAPIEIKKF